MSTKPPPISSVPSREVTQRLRAICDASDDRLAPAMARLARASDRSQTAARALASSGRTVSVAPPPLLPTPISPDPDDDPPPDAAG